MVDTFRCQTTSNMQGKATEVTELKFACACVRAEHCIGVIAPATGTMALWHCAHGPRIAATTLKFIFSPKL